MRWSRNAFSDAELLRTAPVLWSLNLHRLPKRLLWFSTSFAILAVILWSHAPRIDPLIIAAIGLGVAWISAALIIVRYSGVPSDEFVPAPLSVHWQALTARFIVLVPVMLAPLALGEIVASGIQATPKVELVSEINDINVGALACCALSSDSPACSQRRFIPHEPREAEQMLAHGLPLLVETSARTKVESCHNAIDCLTALTGRFESAIVKHQEYKNRGPLGTHADEKDDPVDPGTGVGVTAQLPLACRKVQHRHFVDAAANIRMILAVSGVVGTGERAIPLRYYVDALQWAAWLSVLAAMDTLAGAAITAILAIFLPAMAALAPLLLYFILFVVFHAPELGDAQIAAWLDSHIIGIVEGYFALCCLAYPVAAWRLVRRPPDQDRGVSLGYFTGFPLLVLGLSEAAGLSQDWAVINDDSLRILSFVLLAASVALLGWLRREGVKMRALPKPAPARAREAT